MAVKVDAGARTFVVYCTDCPWWTALRLDQRQALVRANEHERSVHPKQKQASSALSTFDKRHAAETGIVLRSTESSAHGNSRPARTR